MTHVVMATKSTSFLKSPILFQNKIEDSVSNEEVEIDIDELLDMESDEHRRRHLQVLPLQSPPFSIAPFWFAALAGERQGRAQRCERKWPQGPGTSSR